VYRKATIVGGGLSGALFAIYLARRGCEVDVYDARGDIRHEPPDPIRSVNLTIAARGLDGLRRVGLDQQAIDKLCTVLRYRVIHDSDGPVRRMSYGVQDHEVLYSVSRTHLTQFLLDVAAAEPGVRLHFHHRLVDLDKTTATATFFDGTGAIKVVRADVVVGADGAGSAVRRHMQSGLCADFSREYVPYRYKPLSIDAGNGDDAGLDPHGLHLWPRGDFMLFALPNQDYTLNGVCVLPAHGPNSFDSLRTPEAVESFFGEHFADAMPYMPRLVDEFLGRPASGFSTIRTSTWHYRDKVVLIGDACHGVIPFYGQGMNAAFEDCVVLDQCLAAHWRDWQKAFAEYERRRRVNTDTLAELSLANFTELRDSVRRPSLAARSKMSLAAYRALGDRAAPLYSLVSHSTTPYSECVRIARHRQRVARMLGADLAVACLVGAESVKRRLKPGRDRRS
jgi:kynurenine 3-monooxygenase